MPNPTGPTNPVLVDLIVSLRKDGREKKSKFLLKVADLLERPARNISGVSLNKVSRIGKDVVVVPGKVLNGRLDKKAVIAAVSFSEAAKKSIEVVGGEAVYIGDYVKKNPKGTGVFLVV